MNAVTRIWKAQKMMRLNRLPKLLLPSGRPLSIRTISSKLRLNVPQDPKFSSRSQLSTRSVIRFFTYTHHFREDGSRPQDQRTRKQIQHMHETSNKLSQAPIQKSESAGAKTRSSSKADLLLSGQSVSNNEQRKADWAILKEMSKYLWPSVCLDVRVRTAELG